MRGLAVFAAAAATAALVVAMVALVTAGEDEESRTIELASITDPQTESSADLGEEGDSAGDIFTFSEEAQQDGEPVGRMFGSCTLAGTEQEGRGLCSFTIELDEGEITAAGTIDFREEDQPQDFPIAGGTGEFEHASGTLTVQPGEEETALTIEVTTEDGE